MKANMNTDQTASVKYKLPNCRTMHVLTGMKTVRSTPDNDDSVALQPRNYQVSKEVVHGIKIGDKAVIQI